jgi:membrane protein DedA with SNARE-associated domain
MAVFGPLGTTLPVAAGDRDPGVILEPRGERLKQELDHVLARVQPLINRYGYPALFLTIMVEGVGILAPGQSVLIAASLTAAHGHLNLFWVLFWAFMAAVLGNSLGYLIGRWGGRALLLKCKVREDRLARLEGYFRRYGGGVVLLARFFDGLRQLNGIVAGILKMPWGVFTVFNLLGAILWIGVWGWGAYVLDLEIKKVHIAFGKIEPWVVAGSLVGFMAVLIYLFRHLWTKKSGKS